LHVPDRSVIEPAEQKGIGDIGSAQLAQALPLQAEKRQRSSKKQKQQVMPVEIIQQKSILHS
jgi:hypothetical protein